MSSQPFTTCVGTSASTSQPARKGPQFGYCGSEHRPSRRRTGTRKDGEMTLGTKGGILLSCAALALSTSVGFASGSASDDGQPGPSASPPAKAKAYGRSCQNQSKKHAA